MEYSHPEEFIVAQQVQKFRAFYETLMSCFFRIEFNIISPSKRRYRMCHLPFRQISIVLWRYKPQL